PLQQGRGAARRRRLRTSQGRAVGDRRKEARRLRRAGGARRRPSRAQGISRGEEDMGSRDQGGSEEGGGTCRRAVEPRDLEAGLHRRRRGRKGRSGAISARSSGFARKAAGRRQQVQGDQMSLRPSALKWGLLPALTLALLCSAVLPASA